MIFKRRRRNYLLWGFLFAILYAMCILFMTSLDRNLNVPLSDASLTCQEEEGNIKNKNIVNNEEKNENTIKVDENIKIEIPKDLSPVRTKHFNKKYTWVLDNGNTDDKNGSQLLHIQQTLLSFHNNGHLRTLESRRFRLPGISDMPFVSGLLTRIYDSKKVKEVSGRMTKYELLPYFKQSELRKDSKVRLYDGIIDMDKKIFKEMVQGEVVDEMLLLVFNDWDHDVEKYLAVLQTIAVKLQIMTTTSINEIPEEVTNAFNNLNISFSHVTNIRRNAFENLLNIKEWNLIRNRTKNYITIWPSNKKEQKPLQIIAAIRPADFTGYDFFGSDTFRMTIQTPAIYFCTKGIRLVQAYNGPVTLKSVSDFIISSSISNLQLKSANELRSVLNRFDKIALIVCKGAGYNSENTSSPIRDILFDSKIDTRFRLSAARPTFFIQEENFEKSNEINWNELSAIHTEQLDPDSLQFMAIGNKYFLPSDFIQQLQLLPVNPDVRLLVLDRVELSPNGERGESLKEFSARVLLFPPPSIYSSRSIWSRTFGARLVDFVETNDFQQPFLTRVTGFNFQTIYEEHFRFAFSDLIMNMRRGSSTYSNNNNNNNTIITGNKDMNLRLLVLLIVSEDKGNCEGAIFNVAQKNRFQSSIRYVIVDNNESPAFVNELRFTIRRQYTNREVENCEVYVFHADGNAHSMDIKTSELLSPNSGLIVFLKNTKQNEEKKEQLQNNNNNNNNLIIRHPESVELRVALSELRERTEKGIINDMQKTFQTSLYGGSNGKAPWMLLMPPFEVAPFLIYKDSSISVINTPILLLLHDSSCGMTTNHLKAFRLLMKCQTSLSQISLFPLVEYDLSETYLTPSSQGQRLRSSSKDLSEEERSKLYNRLELFLDDTTHIRPPKFIALNGTHVVTTLSTSLHYSWKKNEKGNKLENGFIRVLARLVNTVYEEVSMESLLICMHDVLASEKRERNGFRPDK